jgi:hypothetical protein
MLPLYVKHLDIIFNFVNRIVKGENEAGIESKLVKE